MQKELCDNLSKESKKLIEELKPELEKINKNRIMKQDLIDKLKSKKEVKQNANMSSLVNKSIENLNKEIKFKLSKFNYNN